MKASGHLECVAWGQKILQYRQFIFLPFLTGTCIDVFFPSSLQLCLYGGCFYLLLDKTHIPLLLATWVAVSQANSSGTDGPRVFSVTVPAVGCSPCLPEIRANHSSINVFLGETRWHEFHSGVSGSLDEESSVFSKPYSIWHKHRRKTAIINSRCVC